MYHDFGTTDTLDDYLDMYAQNMQYTPELLQ